MLHESGSNVSMTAEAKTLTDISDGFSRLYVEFVEKTYTTGGDKSFWVYYVPDVTKDEDDDGYADIDNSSIEVIIKDLGEKPALAEGAKGDVISRDEELSTDDRNFYSFKLNGQSDTDDLSSVFQVKASNGATDEAKLSTLYRDVTVKIIKKMDMIPSLDPQNLVSGTDQTTTLKISLKDELPESMFPLEFYIEDSNRTLNPTGTDGSGNSIDVPVKLGTSLIDPNDKTSYYFIRTVNHDEYEKIYEAAKAATPEGEPVVYSFDTEFKTIKEASATTIYIDNDYFNPQSIDLYNHPSFLTPSTQTVRFNATTATVNVNVESGVEWTAVVDGGATFSGSTPSNAPATKAVSGNTASGTGPATLTVAFDANGTDEGKTYKVTVTAGDTEEVAKIIQGPQPQTYAVRSNDFTINNHRGFASNSDVTINLANATSETGGIRMGYRGNGSNNYGTITISSTSKNITGVTVSYSNSNNAGYDTNASSSPTGYTVNSTEAVGTWTGSAKTVTITNSMTTSQGNRNFPVITGITVTYE